MAFNISLSGLAAARAELDATGNNIANSNTTGFKRSRTEFADVFSRAIGGGGDTATGNGVKVAAVTQQFDQGNIESTNSALDLAINGGGFFVLSNNGTQTYTRDGAFQIDANGYLVNSSGLRVQAFPPDGNGDFNTGGLSDIQLNTGVGAPNATTQINAGLNFAADAEIIPSPAPPALPVATDIDSADPSTYNFTTAVTVYDSLGAPHTATLYARRLDNLDWGTRVYVDGTDIGTQDLNFDSNGQLTTGQPLTFPTAFTPTNGASAITLNFDFTNTTTLGTGFSVNDLTQDGFTTGQLIGVDISNEGVIAARFTNGRSTSLGKIALADFGNTQGLTQLGDNQWAESVASGAVQIGEAGVASYGLLESGGLEQSNVDLSTQLVKLITAQRAFQANSQVITVEDEVTQTAINI